MGYVSILTNKSGTLYVGSTKNLKKRLVRHQWKNGNSFTFKYRINRLIYFEKFDTLTEAKVAEKKLKGWVRKKKLELIHAFNPTWKDLSQLAEILRH